METEELEPAKFVDEHFHDQADFRAALRRFLRFSEDQARAHGLTPQQHLLLLAVRGHRGYPFVSIGDLAEASQVRHHSASLLVSRCVRRGLLHRVQDETDRRRVLLQLSAEGQQSLDEITAANRREMVSLRSSLLRDFRHAVVAHESAHTASTLASDPSRNRG